MSDDRGWFTFRLFSHRPGEEYMKLPPVLNRPLGRTEHIYWLLDQLYCLNFLAFAEVEGSLEKADLQAALDIVQQENPVLRSHIIIDKKKQPCFQAV